MVADLCSDTARWARSRGAAAVLRCQVFFIILFRFHNMGAFLDDVRLTLRAFASGQMGVAGVRDAMKAA